MEQSLDNGQHGAQHDYFATVQELIDKTKVYDALVARHNQLVALVPKVYTPEVEPEIRMTLTEIDRNMKEILARMEELEQLCVKVSFFEQERDENVS